MFSFVRCRLALLCVSLILFHPVAAPQSSTKPGPAELRGLVPPSDPLTAQDLSFDASFAQHAIQYLRSNDPKLASRMAESPAITHLSGFAMVAAVGLEPTT
jgi:hypothetical protein